MSKIYIVEDDDTIRNLIIYALKSSDFEAEGFENSTSFYDALKAELPHLVLLDIMIPGEDGISILKNLKNNNQTKDLPVILVSAKSSEFDLVHGLDLGADDYITKPFSVLELISRVRAVLRRTTTKDNYVMLTVGDLTICPSKRTVTSMGKEISLTFKEFELLYYLMENEGFVVTRDNILDKVWGFDFFDIESRTVDVHIKTLRKKLEESAKYIKTIRNIGYKLEVNK